jgi:hypothetical protein
MSTLTKISLGCGVMAAVFGTIATVYTGAWIWSGIGLSSLAMSALRVWTEGQMNGRR